MNDWGIIQNQLLSIQLEARVYRKRRKDTLDQVNGKYIHTLRVYIRSLPSMSSYFRGVACMSCTPRDMKRLIVSRVNLDYCRDRSNHEQQNNCE